LGMLLEFCNTRLFIAFTNVPQLMHNSFSMSSEELYQS
jgi:hypothetical protein